MNFLGHHYLIWESAKIVVFHAWVLNCWSKLGHLHCDHFVLNQFGFSHPMEKIPLVIYTPKEEGKQCTDKMPFLFWGVNRFLCHVNMAAKNKNGETLYLCWRLLHRTYTNIASSQIIRNLILGLLSVCKIIILESEQNVFH